MSARRRCVICEQLTSPQNYGARIDDNFGTIIWCIWCWDNVPLAVDQYRWASLASQQAEDRLGAGQ